MTKEVMNEQRHININHETIKRILGVKTPEQAEKMYAEHLEAEETIKALEEALKQEEDEPVAYVHGDDLDNMLGDRLAFIQRDKSGHRATPLYTTPQQRKPLTDEQKTKIARMFSDRVANECNINAEDHWKLHSVSVLDDINFILQAIQEIKE